MGQSITNISTEEDFRKTKTMSRAIRCLVFVAILASIGQGRVIEKRSPGVASDVGKQIDRAIYAAGDFSSDAIDEITDFVDSNEVRRAGNKVVDVANDVGDAIGDLFGRKKRSPGVASDVGKHIDTAIDAARDVGSDAIDEITDFANSDEVRRAGNKVVDVANDVRDAFEDAFDDAGSAIKDIFGRKKRSPGVADYYYHDTDKDLFGRKKRSPGVADYYHDDDNYT